MIACTADEKLFARWRSAGGVWQRISDCTSLESAVADSDDAVLVLLDLEMPGLDPARAAMLCRSHPTVNFFFLSGRPEGVEGARLIEAGAKGYGNRYMNPELLRQAIEVISLGEIWLGKQLVEYMIRGLSGSLREGSEAPVVHHFGSLTPREREIALKVAQGESNKSIADSLNITERTVKAHLSAIFHKTNTRNRLQLALLLNQLASDDTLQNRVSG